VSERAVVYGLTAVSLAVILYVSFVLNVDYITIMSDHAWNLLERIGMERI
jgi:hypothetical protein